MMCVSAPKIQKESTHIHARAIEGERDRVTDRRNEIEYEIEKGGGRGGGKISDRSGH